MNNTWFYKAQSETMDLLAKRYTNRGCQWQQITEDRVIESHMVKHPDKTNWEFIEVHFIKQEDNVRVLVAEINYSDDFNVDNS